MSIWCTLAFVFFIDSTVIRQFLLTCAGSSARKPIARWVEESKKGIFRRKLPFFIKTKEYSAKVLSEPGRAGHFTKDYLV